MRKAEKLMKKYKKAKTKSIKYMKKAKTLHSEARSICPHDDCNGDLLYHEGTYDTRAYTITKLYCMLCGELISETTEIHSWFG